MDIRDKAWEMLTYLRDLVEDTNNNKEAILVYEQLGKMYQEDKEYKMAIIAFKRMLQAAWVESDQHYETKAYEYLALQHFYLQVLSKASVYKLKAFHGEIEDATSVSKKQAISARINYKNRCGIRNPKPER